MYAVLGKGTVSPLIFYKWKDWCILFILSSTDDNFKNLVNSHYEKREVFVELLRIISCDLSVLLSRVYSLCNTISFHCLQ